MANPPTDRQLEVLEFMRRFQRENHMPPTVREIANEFGWTSTNAAVDHLSLLARKHLVVHRPRTARGWRALSPSETGEV